MSEARPVHQTEYRALEAPLHCTTLPCHRTETPSRAWAGTTGRGCPHYAFVALDPHTRQARHERGQGLSSPHEMVIFVVPSWFCLRPLSGPLRILPDSVLVYNIFYRPLWLCILHMQNLGFAECERPSPSPAEPFQIRAVREFGLFECPKRHFRIRFSTTGGLLRTPHKRQNHTVADNMRQHHHAIGRSSNLEPLQRFKFELFRP